MGERFKENCSVKSELWTVPDAKHAMMMKSNHNKEYKVKILNCFDTAVIE